MKTGRQAGLAFIFITILIDVLGFGLIIPVLPKLVAEMAGPDAGPEAYGWLLSVYGLMQFVFAPVLGNLSDRYGRRPVLLISLLFTGIDYVLQALAPTLAWFFVGRIIAGITGASFTAATAYIADVSPPEKRAQNFGIIGAAFGLGFVVGPVLGGFLGTIGPRVPFWAAAALALLNLAYGAFVLPESLAQENRRPFALRNVNPFAALAILARHRTVLVLAGSASLLWLAQQVPPSIWVLYTTYKFHWTEVQNGWALAVLGLSSMFVQTVLIRLLAPLGDRGRVAFGFLFNAIGFVAIGLATQSWMMIAALIVWTFCFVGGPAMQSIISQQYGPDEQGAVQGALTGIQSLTGVIGPPILTSLFASSTSAKLANPMPGAPFFLGALLTVFAAVLSVKVLRQSQAQPEPAPEPA
jgi:DHA1 family tetracycline resistance protein-like MFS transporter